MPGQSVSNLFIMPVATRRPQRHNLLNRSPSSSCEELLKPVSIYLKGNMLPKMGFLFKLISPSHVFIYFIFARVNVNIVNISFLIKMY